MKKISPSGAEGSQATQFVAPVYERKPGPIENRKCRDSLFILLFLVFWFGMFYIAALALKNGDPRKILIPQDSYGNFCGYNNGQINSTTQIDLSSKPNLYYFNPFLGVGLAVCVTTCPTTTSIYDYTQAICAYNTTVVNNNQLVLAIAQGLCAPFTVDSFTLLQRCVPFDPLPASITNQAASSNITVGANSTVSANAIIGIVSTQATLIFGDLISTWPYLIGGVVASMIICFLWIYLMKWFATPFVYLFLIGSNATCVGLSIWLYYFWQDTLTTYNNTPTNLQLSSQYSQCKSLEAGFIILSIFTALLLILTISLRKRIGLAVTIIRLASKVVGSMPSIVLLPVFEWSLFTLLVFYAVFILVYLITATSTITLGSGITSVTNGNTISNPNMNNFLIIYHLFGFFWTWAVIFGFGQVVIAGSAASYYFTLDKKKLTGIPVAKSVYRAFRYHMGSIILGSIIIAIVRIIRFIVYYIYSKTKIVNVGVLPIKFIFMCILCFLGCLDSLIKFINKNAFIHIAINGTSFCHAAYSSTTLIIRNGWRLLVIDFCADFILFLGKLMVAAGVFFGSWAIIQWQQNLGHLTLNYSFVPAIMIALESLIVSYMFLGVYHMTIDTIFLCFLEDMERNDGSEEKPYYMPDSLKALMSKQEIKKRNKKNSKV